MSKSTTKNSHLDFSSMSESEKEKYADQFAEGNGALKEILLKFWNSGVKTYACCGGHSREEQIDPTSGEMLGVVEEMYVSFDVSTFSDKKLHNLIESLFLSSIFELTSYFSFHLDNLNKIVDNVDGPARHVFTIQAPMKASRFIRDLIEDVLNDNNFSLSVLKGMCKNHCFRDTLFNSEELFIKAITRCNKFDFDEYLSEAEKLNDKREVVSWLGLSRDERGDLEVDVSDGLKQRLFKIESEIYTVAEGMITKDRRDKNKFYTLVGGELQTLTKEDAKNYEEFKEERKFNFTKKFEAGEIERVLDSMIDSLNDDLVL